MPSNKTFIVLILCIGVVISSWLLLRTTDGISAVNNNSNSDISVRNIEEVSNDNWKSLLTNIDTKNQEIYADLTKTKTPEDTTLTSQISKDFLSQYLILKQGGKDLSEAELQQIVLNTLSTENYTKVKGPVYIVSNLKVTGKNDASAQKRYETSVYLAVSTRSEQLGKDPILLIGQTLGPGKEVALAEIDKTINAGKNFIADLLKIEVPSRAVSVHLGLLNAVGNLVADIEAMREMDADPVRSLTGLKQYNNDLLAFQNAFKKIVVYFSNN